MKNRAVIFFVINLLFWIIDSYREYFYWHPIVRPEDSFFNFQILTMGIFYFNYFFLVPKIIKLNNKATFLWWFIIYVGISGIILSSWRTYSGVVGTWDFYTLLEQIAYNIHITFYYGGIGITLRLASDWLDNQEFNESLIIKKTEMQLQFMKSNINIPFMVDVLNSAKKEAEIEPEEVSDPILQLSNVLRYGLYESEGDSIPIRNELEVIEDYVNLVNFNHKNINLKLSIDITQSIVYTLPNFIIKVMGAWISQLDTNAQNLEIIISDSLGHLQLILPDLGADINNFPKPNSKVFFIEYKLETELIKIDLKPKNS